MTQVPRPKTVSRRQVSWGMAWTIPAAVVVADAPAMAASDTATDPLWCPNLPKFVSPGSLTIDPVDGNEVRFRWVTPAINYAPFFENEVAEGMREKPALTYEISTLDPRVMLYNTQSKVLYNTTVESVTITSEGPVAGRPAMDAPVRFIFTGTAALADVSGISAGDVCKTRSPLVAKLGLVSDTGPAPQAFRFTGYDEDGQSRSFTLGQQRYFGPTNTTSTFPKLALEVVSNCGNYNPPTISIWCNPEDGE